MPTRRQRLRVDHRQRDGRAPMVGESGSDWQNPAAGRRDTRRIRYATRPLTVIAVARDTKYRFLGEEPRPFVFVPLAQQYRAARLTIIARSMRWPAPDRRNCDALIASLNPNLPIVHGADLRRLRGSEPRAAARRGIGLRKPGPCRTAARRDGHLRRDRLHGDEPDARNRRSCGARRATGASCGWSCGRVQPAMVGAAIGLALAAAATRALARCSLALARRPARLRRFGPPVCRVGSSRR